VIYEKHLPTMQRIIVIILTIVVLLISGCSPNKTALKQNIDFPEGFELKNFSSFSERSALHSPMYFSFEASDQDFQTIVHLNDLAPFHAMPKEFEFTMKYAIEVAEKKAWPSLGNIDEYQLFSNHMTQNLLKIEYASMLILFDKVDTTYAIVLPLY